MNLTTKSAVWPYNAAEGKFHDFFSWSDCSDIAVSGSALIDGNGYEWWWASVLKTIDDASRPHIFVVNGGRRLSWSGLRCEWALPARQPLALKSHSLWCLLCACVVVCSEELS